MDPFIFIIDTILTISFMILFIGLPLTLLFGIYRVTFTIDGKCDCVKKKAKLKTSNVNFLL